MDAGITFLLREWCKCRVGLGEGNGNGTFFTQNEPIYLDMQCDEMTSISYLYTYRESMIHKKGLDAKVYSNSKNRR
jgi:hypothetical protein